MLFDLSFTCNAKNKNDPYLRQIVYKVDGERTTKKKENTAVFTNNNPFKERKGKGLIELTIQIQLQTITTVAQTLPFLFTTKT